MLPGRVISDMFYMEMFGSTDQVMIKCAIDNRIKNSINFYFSISFSEIQKKIPTIIFPEMYKKTLPNFFYTDCLTTLMEFGRIESYLLWK